MKYALLGGGNPYALALARHLLPHNEVIGIGRSALKGEAFTLGAERLGYQYHVYSIGPDTDFIMDLLKSEKPQVIVNFAAQGEGQASFDVKHWKHFYRTNVQALVELAERLHGSPWLERFIQVGTSELYGSVESAATEASPLRPSSPYAVSKMAFDLHLLSVSKVCGFPALIVRPSNCVCEGQQLHRVIPKALISGMTGSRIPLHGGGRARKSYLHADDLAAAIELLVERGTAGEVYNVGPDEPTAIRRVLELCAQTLGLDPEELFKDADERTGQDGCYWLDSTKIKGLGWKQTIPLMGAVSRVHGWLQDWPELLHQSTDFRIRA
jgi:dTDP-glucose 4,6-dehydratase